MEPKGVGKKGLVGSFISFFKPLSSTPKDKISTSASQIFEREPEKKPKGKLSRSHSIAPVDQNTIKENRKSMILSSPRSMTPAIQKNSAENRKSLNFLSSHSISREPLSLELSPTSSLSGPTEYSPLRIPSPQPPLPEPTDEEKAKMWDSCEEKLCNIFNTLDLPIEKSTKKIREAGTHSLIMDSKILKWTNQLQTESMERNASFASQRLEAINFVLNAVYEALIIDRTNFTLQNELFGVMDLITKLLDLPDVRKNLYDSPAFKKQKHLLVKCMIRNYFLEDRFVQEICKKQKFLNQIIVSLKLLINPLSSFQSMTINDKKRDLKNINLGKGKIDEVPQKCRKEFIKAIHMTKEFDEIKDEDKAIKLLTDLIFFSSHELYGAYGLPSAQKFQKFLDYFNKCQILYDKFENFRQKLGAEDPDHPQGAPLECFIVHNLENDSRSRVFDLGPSLPSSLLEEALDLFRKNQFPMCAKTLMAPWQTYLKDYNDHFNNMLIQLVLRAQAFFNEKGKFDLPSWLIEDFKNPTDKKEEFANLLTLMVSRSQEIRR